MLVLTYQRLYNKLERCDLFLFYELDWQNVNIFSFKEYHQSRSLCCMSPVNVATITCCNILKVKLNGHFIFPYSNFPKRRIFKNVYLKWVPTFQHLKYPHPYWVVLRRKKIDILGFSNCVNACRVPESTAASHHRLGTKGEDPSWAGTVSPHPWPDASFWLPVLPASGS